MRIPLQAHEDEQHASKRKGVHVAEDEAASNGIRYNDHERRQRKLPGGALGLNCDRNHRDGQGSNSEPSDRQRQPRDGQHRRERPRRVVQSSAPGIIEVRQAVPDDLPVERQPRVRKVDIAHQTKRKTPSPATATTRRHHLAACVMLTFTAPLPDQTRGPHLLPGTPVRLAQFYGSIASAGLWRRPRHAQAVFDAVDQREPAGVDDILACADGAPAVGAVLRVDQHPGDRAPCRSGRRGYAPCSPPAGTSVISRVMRRPAPCAAPCRAH